MKYCWFLLYSQCDCRFYFSAHYFFVFFFVFIQLSRILFQALGNNTIIHTIFIIYIFFASFYICIFILLLICNRKNVVLTILLHLLYKFCVSCYLSRLKQSCNIYTSYNSKSNLPFQLFQKYFFCFYVFFLNHTASEF